MSNLKKSNYGIYHSYYLNDSVEKVLKRLEPYKPKKLILGNHFLPRGCTKLYLIGNKSDDPKHSYRGIPVEVSEDKYEIDFEL